MKKLLNFLTLASFIFISSFSCEKSTDKQDFECNENSIIESYSNISGKVFLNNKFVTYQGDTSYVYAIILNHIVGDISPNELILFNDSILAPINLPDKFKINNLMVMLSGDKLNCCNILTQPSLRVGYGCKFRISKISEL